MKNSRAISAALLGFALLVSISIAGSAGGGIRQTKVKPPKAEMTWPRAGDIFFPGDQVTVTWDVKPGNVTFCEQELYLVVNGGKWFRISRELGEDSRSFEWTVPDMPTENALLVINLGCDRRPYVSFEGTNVQTQAPFQILAARNGYQSVEVAALDRTTVQPGENIPIRWKSSVEDVDAFEVMVSYDRGAHFLSIGETRDTSFVWTSPKDFSGTVAFSVVARKSNGARIEASPRSDSLIDIRRRQ